MKTFLAAALAALPLFALAVDPAPAKQPQQPATAQRSRRGAAPSGRRGRPARRAAVGRPSAAGTPMPASEDWNACAAPWKLAKIGRAHV